MSEVEIDMAEHFQKKLRRLIMDIADTCERAEIGRSYIISMVIGGMLMELVKAIAALQMSETDFIKLCRIAYQELKEEKEDSA